MVQVVPWADIDVGRHGKSAGAKGRVRREGELDQKIDRARRGGRLAFVKRAR
jgi:hypothetical protein